MTDNYSRANITQRHEIGGEEGYKMKRKSSHANYAVITRNGL